MSWKLPLQTTIIIPALNEEACIGQLVAALPRTLAHEIIVVDNGSTDRTAEVAAVAGARVIHQSQRGYGNACLAGMHAARDAELLVFMDGDLSDDPAELPNVIAPILRNEADLVLGIRTRVAAGALTPQQIVGNRVALFLIRLLLGKKLQDLPSFKAVRCKTLMQLHLQERTYGWTTELLVKAVKQNVRISEVSTVYRKRGGGQSKVAGTLRGTVGAGYAILRVVARYAF